MSTLRERLRRFARDEQASVLAELVLIMPPLMAFFVGMLVYFDAYVAKDVNLKAAYTVADMLSRESDPVDSTYLEGLDDVFDYLTAGSGTNGMIRVTLVRCTKDCLDPAKPRVLATDWSYATDTREALTDADLVDFDSVIPTMPLGERVILMETFTDYTPAFNVGIPQTDFDNIVVTRPRFAPQICFQGETCGLS